MLSAQGLRAPMLVVVWAITVSWSLGTLTRLPARSNQLDFSHYYLSALLLREGLNPYASDLNPLAAKLGLAVDAVNHAAINHANYPPTFLLCFEALTVFPPVVAYWIWIGINVAVFALALWLLLRGSALDTGAAWFVAALAVMYPAVGIHFFYAQSQIVILLMLVIAARWMEAEHDAGAGLTLAFASLLRIFPLLLAGYLVVQRRWRVLGYMALGLLLGGCLTLALAGVSRSLGFLGQMGFLTSTRWAYEPANVALASFIRRIFVYTGAPPSPAFRALRDVIVAASEIGLLGLTAAVTRARADGRDPDWRAFSLWIVAMIMLSPTAWPHYLVLLLIPFTQIASAVGAGRGSRAALAWAMASYALAFLMELGLAMTAGKLGPGIAKAIKEYQFVSLAMAYLSAYCFACDTCLSRNVDGTERWRTSCGR